MSRRIITARDQVDMLSPWRIAAPVYEPHPDVVEYRRLHGVSHTSNGRRMPGQHLAVADQRTQETRLLDPLGWKRHVSFTPSGLAIAGARAYSGMMGLPDPHAQGYEHVRQTPERVREIGRNYDALPSLDRSAVHHWDALRGEVNDQHDFLTRRLGIRTPVVDHDPYSDVHEMMDDINHNKTLKVMSTATTGGHPLLSNDENDRLRAVHDFFGHAATGRSFDRHGEEAAYQAHAAMFTPASHPALGSELRGQNATLILNGHFGPQKVATLDPRHWTP